MKAQGDRARPSLRVAVGEPRTTRPVAIYARYSTDRQDARSIDDQMRRCRAYAAAHDYEVAAEFSDAAMSGAHVDRADMQRLLATSRTKGGAPFRAALVDDLS
jgi:DNA invertase Pin-like site-specific DNA recombinase